MAATDYAVVVQQLYISYFGRPADPFGLADFQNQLLALNAPTDLEELNAAVQANPGSPLSNLVRNFNGSQEAINLYGTGTSRIEISKFVNAVYQNVLNRDADNEGGNFWIDAIINGTVSKADAALSITTAASLNTSGTAQGARDALAVANKAAVAKAFVDALDTIPKVNSYSGDAAAAAARALLKSVNADTNTTAFQANVRDAVEALNPPQINNVSLTTGTDTFVGTSANDVITAVLNNTGTGQAQTLNAFDSIDGGLGNNTLNINDFSTGGTTDALNSVTVKNVQTLNLGSQQAVTINTTAVTGLTTLAVSAIGAESVTAAATTAITANAAQVAANNVTIAGGSSINATVAGVTTGGAINIGSSTTAGAINAVVSVAAPTGGVSSTGSAITVAGGTTVSVTQNIAAVTNLTPGTAATANGGSITVNGGASTTAVTVNQTAAVAVAAGTAVVAPATEVATLTADAGGLAALATLTVAGLTFTAGGTPLTQAQVASIFAGLANGATTGAASAQGSYSGTFTGYTTSAAVSNVVTFTSTAANATVTDLATSGTGAAAAVAAVTTQGTPGAAAVAGSSGIAVGGVTITDANSANTDSTKANTITSVTLNNYAGATINSNALSTLSLTNGSGTVTVNDNSATATALTLGLTVNGLKSGAALVDAKATTLNIAATGANSALNVTGAALKTITVSGDKSLNLGNSGIGVVTAITSTNTAGVTTGLNVDQAGTFSAGNNTVTVAGGATKAITFGAGNDTVNITTLASTASISGGAGTDTLGLSAANAVIASGNPFTQVTGFEVLSVGAVGASSIINLTNLNNAGANAFTKVVVAGATNALTLNGLTANNTIELTAAATGQTITANLNDNTGTADVLNISVKNAAGISAGTIVAAGVETVRFATDDTASTATGIQHTATLTDAAAKSITVTGDAGLALTFSGTALTSFDASGVTKGAVSWTSADQAAALTVTGGAGANTINLGSTTKAVTYTGGAGVDTITTGSGTATVTTGAGADVINLGSGAATVNAGAGDDIINLGAGLNIVTGGAGNDTFNLNGVVIPNGNTYSTITDFGAGDSIVFTTGTFAAAALGARVTLAGTAAFADFLQAAAASTFAGGANSAVKWFQFGGDTYVVNDRSAGDTSFVNGTDQVIKLTGIVDLSASTTSAGGIVTFVAPTA